MSVQGPVGESALCNVLPQGQFTITAGWMETSQAVGLTTVTLKVQLLVLPQASVATQVTSVVPIGNTEPDTGVVTTETSPGQLSVACAEKFTTVPLVLVAVTSMSAGHWIEGGVGS